MKLGIIGYGNMAVWHKNLIEGIDRLSIAGIWDTDPKRRDKAEQDNIKVFNSQEELLAQKDIELVLIATPNKYHCQIAIDAMRAGKNVVCEKPIALSTEEIDRMTAVSLETGKILTVHQNRRWDSDFLTVKNILETNKLGKVFRIETRVHGDRGISYTWRREKAMGGGVVYDWGVHLIDQVLQLQKGTTLTSVYATSNKITTAEVEDCFTSIIKFSNNMEYLVEVSTCNFEKLPRWYVLGNRGSAVVSDWDVNGEIITCSGDDNNEVKPVVTSSAMTKTMAPRLDRLIKKENLEVVPGEIKDFYNNVIDAVENKAKPVITLTEAKKVLKVLEMMFESIDTQSVIKCHLEN